MVAKMKMQDIAEKTGYSISTVSRVLSGTSYASNKARDAIIECARELGLLNVLGNGHLLLKGILVFAPSRAFTPEGDAFYHEVMQGIAETVKPHNVHLAYCVLEENHADIQLFLERVKNKNINAIILIGVDDPTIHQLATTLNMPCVLVNAQDKRMQLDSVSPDQQAIGYNGVRHLFEEGHRRILTITSMRRETFYQRIAGTREAYRDYHVDFNADHNLLITEGLTEKEAEHALASWLKTQPRSVWPEAIYCQSGDMIGGVKRVLNHYGLQIPQDISLMATNYELPQEANPQKRQTVESSPQLRVTNITIPCHELGREAVYILQTRFSRPDAPIFNLLLKGKLERHGTVAHSTKNAAYSELSSAERSVTTL